MFGSPQFEIIDCPELAKRWSLPESWIREQLRSRAAAIDPPCALWQVCPFPLG